MVTLRDSLGARDLCLLLSSFCCVSFSRSSSALVIIFLNLVALRLVWKALDEVKRWFEWLTHPETVRSVPGCSSARLEVTGTESHCILCSLNKGCQASTRMLFSLTGRHWSVTNFGEHIIVVSSIETGWCYQVLPDTETLEPFEQEQDVPLEEHT